MEDKSFRTVITPAIIIWHRTLLEVPLWSLDGNNQTEFSLRHYEQLLKECVGKRSGNRHQFFQITMGGHYFPFSIHFSPQVNPKKYFHWEFHVWNMTGHETVNCYEFPSTDKEHDMMPKEIYLKAMQDCEDYARGIKICSGCQKKVNSKEIAGHYFAGSYCSHCWETKYKAIEAKENYN